MYIFLGGYKYIYIYVYSIYSKFHQPNQPMCDWPSASDPLWASHAHRCEEDRGGAQPQEPGGGTVGRPERLLIVGLVGQLR